MCSTTIFTEGAYWGTDQQNSIDLDLKRNNYWEKEKRKNKESYKCYDEEVKFNERHSL